MIKGKVQGVFYRATARDVAESIGITGWVKNTSHGNVEALISGSESQLETFINWCKQGPSNAVVTGVEVTEWEEEVFPNFTIIRK